MRGSARDPSVVRGDASPWWSLRGGMALVPFYANLPTMDWRIGKSRGLMAEYEVRYKLRELPGASSLLLFLNTARMGSYEQVLENPAAYGNDVAATREDGRTKYGFALSVEQQVEGIARLALGRQLPPRANIDLVAPAGDELKLARRQL